MTAPAESGRAARFKRILMALDSAGGGPDAIDLVAALAAQLNADLFGLFVEDIDLVHLAGLPWARAVSTLSADRAPLDPELVERALRVRVAHFRQAMEEAARRRRISASFEVRRGRVAAEIVATVRDADLVVVSWSGGRMGQAPGADRLSTLLAQIMAKEPACSVLLLRGAAGLGGPILVAYDGSPPSERALETALQLARGIQGAEGAPPLEVVLITGRPEQAERWQRDLAPRLAERGLAARFVHLLEGDVVQLCRAARRDHAAILVLGADLPLLQDPQAQTVLGQSESSVLLVR